MGASWLAGGNSLVDGATAALAPETVPFGIQTLTCDLACTKPPLVAPTVSVMDPLLARAGDGDRQFGPLPNGTRRNARDRRCPEDGKGLWAVRAPVRIRDADRPRCSARRHGHDNGVGRRRHDGRARAVEGHRVVARCWIKAIALNLDLRPHGPFAG